MNPIKWFKSLFAAPPEPPREVANPVKPPAEPSCLIKGIAQAWIDGKGWKVSRTRILSNSGFGVPYLYWSVTLRHRELDITLDLKESSSLSKPAVYDIGVMVAGKQIGMPGDLQDSRYLREVIESHPYSSLRSRQTAYAKREASRATALKRIEELGCPVVTSGEPPIQFAEANANEP